MARIRTIKPEFWTDSKTGTLSPEATKLFIGMLNFSDDFGFLEYNLDQLRAKIFPYLNGSGSETVGKFLTDELLPKGLVILVSWDKKTYLWIKNFEKHQKVDHPAAPIIPNFDREKFLKTVGETPNPRESSRILANPRSVREGNGREGNGMEGNGKEGKGLEGGGIGGVGPGTQDQQRIVDRYLHLKGVDLKDKSQVVAMYRRHVRSALALVKEAGGVDVALLAVEWASTVFDKKGLTWTLDTVAKHLPEFFRRGKEDLIGAKHNLTPNQVQQLKKLAEWNKKQEEAKA